LPNLPTTPLLTQQSYLNDIRVYSAWNDGYSGAGVRIGQFEPGDSFATGPEVLNYTHPDLAGNIDPAWLQAGAIPTLFSNHATLVAGVMVATNNNYGTTGIAYRAKISGYYLANSGLDFTALGKISNFDIVNHSWDFDEDFGFSNILNQINTITDILINAQYAAKYGRGGLGTVRNT
jgi:hypothetical protein